MSSLEACPIHPTEVEGCGEGLLTFSKDALSARRLARAFQNHLLFNPDKVCPVRLTPNLQVRKLKSR